MKKISLIFSLLMMAALLFSAPAFSADPIEINLSLIIPSTHSRYAAIIGPWTKMVEEKTNGAVKFTPYFTASLAPAREQYQAAVTGLADISENITYITPGRFPLTEIFMLPNKGVTTALGVSEAFWKLYKTNPQFQNEYRDVKLLWLHSSPLMSLTTTKKPVRTLADLKGMKIWASGTVSVMTVKQLGAIPVPMGPGDVYMALEKGVIDGAMADYEIVMGRRWDSVCKYFTEVNLSNIPFFVVMNKDKWNSLPPDIQKVFEELTGDFAVEMTGKIRDHEEMESKKLAQKAGIEVITLTPEAEAEFSAALAPVADKYAADLESKGLPGKELVAEVMKMK